MSFRTVDLKSTVSASSTMRALTIYRFIIGNTLAVATLRCEPPITGLRYPRAMLSNGA